MKKSLFLALNFIAFFAIAQDEPTYNLQFAIERSDQIETLMPRVDGFADNNSRLILMEQSVRSFVMPPRKAINPALAACYITTAALEYYHNLDNNFKENLSPEYIHIGLSDKKNTPTAIETFNFLHEEGTISAGFMPYGSKVLARGLRTVERFTIEKYLHLIRPETKKNRKIFETKKAIMRGNPVILEVRVDDSFENLGRDLFWTPEKGTKKSDKTTYLLAVSYNDDKEGIEVLNCRGRKWGNRGGTWIRYEDYEDLIVNAYLIVPSELK